MKMPDKIFSAASYCTSGGLICTGLAQTYDWFHGLDWNFIALASGVIIGAATYFTNLYFKRRWTISSPSIVVMVARHRRMNSYGQSENETQCGHAGANRRWCFSASAV